MKDMGRVMALVKERLGGLDRSRPRQRLVRAALA